MICEICGSNFENEVYCGRFKKCCSSECFNKKFWNDIKEEKDKHVFIDGVCYSIANESTLGILGFGGRKFKIKMLDDGRIIETNNLWCQGDVPEEYRSILPNTAEFVR